MTVYHFGKGDIIGANLIFSSTQCYPMTITAKKHTEVITIQENSLFKLCKAYPAFLMKLTRAISNLSVLIATKMKNRISRTIRQSILTYLSKQYKLQKNSSIKLTMSKKSLAEMSGLAEHPYPENYKK